MVITIELTKEQEAQLLDQAARRGEEPAQFVHELVARSLQPAPTLSEILAPFRQQVEESGVTDAELDELIEEARNEAYQARQASAK
jgi:hypothetical protein